VGRLSNTALQGREAHEMWNTMRKELGATVEAFEKVASQDMVEAGTMMASDCYAGHTT